MLTEIAPDGTPTALVPLAPDEATGEPRNATGAVVSVEPGSGAVRYAGCQTSVRTVSTWISRPSGSTRNSFGWWSSAASRQSRHSPHPPR